MPPEDHALWVAYVRSGATADRNRIVERYMPLVRSIAFKLCEKTPNCVEEDAMRSAGAVGLIQAVEAFELERKVKFETYATTRIYGAMIDELRSLDWAPRSVRTAQRLLAQAERAVYCRKGREGTDVEVARQMKIPVAALRAKKRENVPGVFSANNPVVETDSGRVTDLIATLADPGAADPQQTVKRDDFSRFISRGLGKNLRLILILYYSENLTFKQIGETIGLSESRVSQLHRMMLEFVRTRLRGRRHEIPDV